MNEPVLRKCDCCGQQRERAIIERVRVKVAGKANVYLAGVFQWCSPCRRDNRGLWKYAG